MKKKFTIIILTFSLILLTLTFASASLLISITNFGTSITIHSHSFGIVSVFAYTESNNSQGLVTVSTNIWVNGQNYGNHYNSQNGTYVSRTAILSEVSGSMIIAETNHYASLFGGWGGSDSKYSMTVLNRSAWIQ